MKTTGILTFVFFILLSMSAWSQARMVFQNDPYVVINDQAYVVIDNPNANAITNPAQGNIVSEDEFNILKWNIGNNTGTYEVPFTTGNSVKIPLTVDISAAGSGGTDPSILFSTYGGLGTAGWGSLANAPTAVLHTLDFATGSVNNSPFVIDRYWVLDTDGYGSRPSATLAIGYEDSEHTAPPNTIIESILGAQRYNTDTDEWGDYLPQGVVNTTSNLVSAIPAPAADFYRAWTLSSMESPLPVELLNFTGTCDNGTMRLEWATASEHNNDYFLIERSVNGSDWEPLKEIPGSGNSSTKIEYNISDYSPLSTSSYYRLTQFDYNGNYRVYDPIAVSCGDYELEIVSVENNYNSSQMFLNVSSSLNETFELYVTDMSGKVMISQQGVTVKDGMNRLEIDKDDMSMGIYLIQLVNDNHLLTRRVAIN